MTAILGISALYHDSAAALVVDGRIVAAAQEERFTRRKHDASMPVNAIAYCLREGGLHPAELDVVVFYEKPLLKFERLLETYLASWPMLPSSASPGLRSFRMAMGVWLTQKLFLPREIDAALGGEYEGPLHFCRHHEAHAASAFYPSPFAEAAILTLDGVGEWSTTTWGIGRGADIRLHAEIRFPHSLGLLYSAFTYYTGFKVNSGEYKLMGLAPYGKPRYADRIREHLIDLRDDGSFWLNLEFFDYCSGLTMTNRSFDALFGGPPRRPESPIEQRHMDLAASIQKVTDEAILKLARHVRQESGQANVCLAGGVALNCVANGLLLREGVFDNLWIQPAAGDAGGALGAALWEWHHVQGNEREPARPDAQQGSCLGPAFTDDDVARALDAAGAVYRRLPEADLFAEAAELLATGRVVGCFQGRMEFGPRALGNRSILGDARDRQMQSRMNRKIKFRESFRPFAPSCLATAAAEYFDLSAPSPYMLLVAPVAAAKRINGKEQAPASGLARLKVPRSVVPAITHVDGSARVQTVAARQHPRYARLLASFAERTGCPLVVNTSFNIRGEPIVCTPEDAYRCFMHTDMDALLIEDCICLKEDQPELSGRDTYQKSFALD